MTSLNTRRKGLFAVTSTKKKKKLQRHSGTLAPHRGIDEIIANAEALKGFFDSLPPKKFDAHVRDNYNVGSRKAQDWLHVARRFGDCPDLVRGLCETNIITLASPDLGMAGAIEIITKINAGEIKRDTRSVKRAAENYKNSKKSEITEEASKDCISAISPRNTVVNNSSEAMIAECRRKVAILDIEEANRERTLNEVKEEKKLLQDIITFLEGREQRADRRDAIRTILRLPQR